MASPARKSIPRTTQIAVMIQSRDRCALCCHWHGDLSNKSGQLAHIDRDRTNCAEANIAFLCQPHHDQYDTMPSQTRRVMPEVLATAKRELQQAIADGRHLNPRAVVITAGRETDREMLAALVRLMAESLTDRFLRDFDFGGQTFHWRELNALGDYVQDSEGATHEFIDLDLEMLRQKFLTACRAFRGLLAQNTASVPWTPTYRGVPQQWRTTAPRRFNATVKRLRAAAAEACAAYDELVRTGRARLAA